ncbi:MAG: MTH1187 family thiamine-binding protein [Planctomycetes bacterium]|nr:MTH1187 family thiamine-binding protein [Planctomycetota bacterium]
MNAIAEIQVVPLGVGVSVRKEVMRAHALLQEAGLTVQLHAYGTNVEGDLQQILDAIRHVHETLHAEGVPRLATNVKLGTRIDKPPTLAGKLAPGG